MGEIIVEGKRRFPHHFKSGVDLAHVRRGLAVLEFNKFWKGETKKRIKRHLENHLKEKKGGS